MWSHYEEDSVPKINEILVHSATPLIRFDGQNELVHPAPLAEDAVLYPVEKWSVRGGCMTLRTYVETEEDKRKRLARQSLAA